MSSFSLDFKTKSCSKLLFFLIYSFKKRSKYTIKNFVAKEQKWQDFFESQVLQYLKKKSFSYMGNPHIGPLQYRPHAKYVKKAIYNEKRRQKIILHWANLSKDLEYIYDRFVDINK